MEQTLIYPNCQLEPFQSNKHNHQRKAMTQAETIKKKKLNAT